MTHPQVGEQSSVSIEKDSSVSVNGNAMQNVGKDNHTYIAGDHISHIDKDTILNVGGSIKGNIMENATFETKGITTIGAQDRLYIKSNTKVDITCLLYTSPSPRDRSLSRMPSSA